MFNLSSILPTPPQIAALFISLGVGYGIARKILSTTRLPPGPPSWPLIGNVLGFSPTDAQNVLLEHKKKLGDIVMIHGLGTYILVLSSMDVIGDLLVKRGDTFSYRPILTFGCELVGLDRSIALMQYGSKWRRYRKMTNAALNTAVVAKYHRLQEKFSVRLCIEMAEKPQDFFEHVALYASRISLATIYGIEVADKHDQILGQVEAAMRFASDVTIPGAFMCDILPFLKYLPSWFSFHKKAAFGRNLVETTIKAPFERVRTEIASGTAPPSFTRDLLSENKAFSSNDIFDIEWATGSLYGPASDTTAATVLAFIAGILLNPEARRTAQAEIDRTIGSQRVPTIDDVNDLPYVGAVMKETMRWRPAVPLGVARRTEGDSLYKDYLIPHDTIVIPNIWAISREPNSKYNPDSFIPERFLDTTQIPVDPLLYIFGFGRRICPGKALAVNSIFIAIATILWAFNIETEPGVEFVPEFQTGLVGYPKPFPCKITPRSAERLETLKKTITMFV